MRTENIWGAKTAEEALAMADGFFELAESADAEGRSEVAASDYFTAAELYELAEQLAGE